MPARSFAMPEITGEMRVGIVAAVQVMNVEPLVTNVAAVQVMTIAMRGRNVANPAFMNFV